MDRFIQATVVYSFYEKVLLNNCGEALDKPQI